MKSFAVAVLAGWQPLGLMMLACTHDLCCCFTLFIDGREAAWVSELSMRGL